MKPQPPCFFRQFHWGECRFRADGRPDRAHLIPQARIKADPFGYGPLWDDRLYVWACRHHHGLFDRKLRQLERDHYPPSLAEWADENGFEFVDSRTGWVRVSGQREQRKEAAA